MLKPIVSNTPRTLVFFLSLLLFPAAVYAQQTFASGFDGEDNVAGKRSAPGESDGCTLWFNGDFEDCCYRHDFAYRKSGLNWRTRLRADNRLFLCIAGKKGIWHLPLAPVMWTGVRIFGSDLLPLSSRNIVHQSFKRMFVSFGKRDKRFRQKMNRGTGKGKWMKFHFLKSGIYKLTRFLQIKLWNCITANRKFFDSRIFWYYYALG